MAVGNIVRRILGIVREVVEDDDAGDQNGGEVFGGGAATPTTQSAISTPALDGAEHPVSQRPGMPSQAGSLFGIFQTPGLTSSSPAATPPLGGSSGTTTPRPTSSKKFSGDTPEKLDIKAEVIDGIKELLDELEVVDTQIAESALDHIHSNEIILTHTSSQTVQKFLVAAAKKRKFTVFHAEAFPNDHLATHATILNGGSGSEDDEKWKPLTSLGIKVILIPDTAVFALMSRVNKVLLAPHTVLANGSLIAAAGASVIAQAAKEHHVPVVVLSGVYKLSPVYPFGLEESGEMGDPSKVVGFEEGELVEGLDVVNPVFDFVRSEWVDLYVMNLGGVAPGYLYRIVGDHYRAEDLEL
jgi:translation initiation factor eIF-2B subunit beta